MLPFIQNWGYSTWNILVDSSFLFLIGVILAGILSLVLNQKTVKKITSGHPISVVFKSALVGLPLPLCSCSVLPVASQLRASGVSKGGVVAFLVSTPESGVDSILLTYALTDPVLTVARPVSAYLTALTAGIVETVGFDDKVNVQKTLETCSSECCCNEKHEGKENKKIIQALWHGIKYAFTDLLRDLSPYLLFGFALSGFLQVIIGVDGLSVPKEAFLGWLGYVWALVIGIPLYICASSSTPLAAVLLSFGMSPGAILVFLLVGPATNITGIIVTRRIIGLWSTVRYLVIIAIVAIVCGLLLDLFYRTFNIIPQYHIDGSHIETSGIIEIIAAICLSCIILYYSINRLIKRLC